MLERPNADTLFKQTAGTPIGPLQRPIGFRSNWRQAQTSNLISESFEGSITAEAGQNSGRPFAETKVSPHGDAWNRSQ